MTIKEFKSREAQEWDECSEEARGMCIDLGAETNLVGVWTLAQFKDGNEVKFEIYEGGYVDVDVKRDVMMTELVAPIVVEILRETGLVEDE